MQHRKLFKKHGKTCWSIKRTTHKKTNYKTNSCPQKATLQEKIASLGRLAQLDRAPASEAGGHAFESHIAHIECSLLMPVKNGRYEGSL